MNGRVPCFYHSDFSLETYGQKLKKRVRTLLIPYIIWNVVVFLLILLSQSPDLVLSPFSYSLLGHGLVLTDIILQLILSNALDYDLRVFGFSRAGYLVMVL